VTTTIKPDKLTFKKIESEWYKYHHTLKEVAELREKIMNPFDEEVNDPTVVAGANSVRNVGDPTGRMAVRLTTSKQLTYLNTMVDAIERVYNALPDDYKKLVRIRYWSRSNKDWNGIADELHVNRSTAIRWRNEIIQATIDLLGWR